LTLNKPRIPYPARRPLKTFRFDPMTSRLSGRMLDIDVTFERDLRPGPSGKLVAVVDYDAGAGTWLGPVDLNDPMILARGGLTPSELDPRSHQQIVYAVAMTVIETFERHLGRRFRWRSDKILVMAPHAFEGQNAFYDPQRSAVLFGSYRADRTDPGRNLPDQWMFTCLSNDIIAHEVTHAILHRLRPMLIETGSLDAPAFHEAAADLVALFLHFAQKEVVVEVIAAEHADLKQGAALFELAREFGESTGRGGALRQALADEPHGVVTSLPTEPHERAACFVAGVFDAFKESYVADIADLLRIATGGTGVLPPGNLHPDLVNRVAAEAIKNADRLLGMVLRAFDYLPVSDVTFGDVVRAIVTADRSLYPDDAGQLRARLVEALRRRGIYPEVSSLNETALAWPAPAQPMWVGDAAAPVDLSVLIARETRRLNPESNWAVDSDSDGEVAGGAELSSGGGADLGAAAVPEGLDAAAQEQEAGRLREFAVQLAAWAQSHAYELGFSAARNNIALRGFHMSNLTAADGQSRPYLIFQFRQRRTDLETDNAPASEAANTSAAEISSTPDASRLGPGHRAFASCTVIARADGLVEHFVSKPLPLSPDELSDQPVGRRALVRRIHAAGMKRFVERRASEDWLTGADALTPWVANESAGWSFVGLHGGLGTVET
jgi:hypothetical protein